MKQMRFRDETGEIRTGEFNNGSVVTDGGERDPETIDVLPPVEPSKVLGVAHNYRSHFADSDDQIPDRPTLWWKGGHTVVASHGDTIELPAVDNVIYEAEIGVVIGTRCRNVSRSNAQDVIAGFTCVNDLSNRDDQEIEQNWVRGKAFDGAAPMGPVVATPDEVPDDARVSLRVNGETKQDSSREHLIFPVPELIEEITTYLTLEPGDVIATGTPEGVGPLSDGDDVEVDIEGVGTLEHSVRIP